VSATAPKLSESIPAVTAPVKLPKLSETRRSWWPGAALVAGVVAAGTFVAGLVIL